MNVLESGTFDEDSLKHFTVSINRRAVSDSAVRFSGVVVSSSVPATSMMLELAVVTTRGDGGSANA